MGWHGQTSLLCAGSGTSVQPWCVQTALSALTSSLSVKTTPCRPPAENCLILAGLDVVQGGDRDPGAHVRLDRARAACRCRQGLSKALRSDPRCHRGRDGREAADEEAPAPDARLGPSRLMARRVAKLAREVVDECRRWGRSTGMRGPEAGGDLHRSGVVACRRARRTPVGNQRVDEASETAISFGHQALPWRQPGGTRAAAAPWRWRRSRPSRRRSPGSSIRGGTGTRARSDNWPGRPSRIGLTSTSARAPAARGGVALIIEFHENRPVALAPDVGEHAPRRGPQVGAISAAETSERRRGSARRKVVEVTSSASGVFPVLE